jgi:serine/threonine-protein kinase
MLPDEETTLPAGSRLGKYQIVRPLGAGGMGAVYEALHTEIGKRVAIKTLSPAVAAIPGARQRFLREAQLTARLRHPHIVDLSDMGAEAGTAFLVMELLAGEDLAHMLARTGPMQPRALVDLVLPVCSALIAAHDAGIVHRDLKPQNIFLANGPRGIEPKVLDFGISKSSDAEPSAGLTGTGSVIGTPHYLAPEQIKDARKAGPASDQYSIGVILYRCLTDREPFDGDSVFSVLQAIVIGTPVPLRELRDDLPEGLDAIVERAMNSEPSERYPSLRDLGRALLPYASPKARTIWEETFGVTPASAGTSPVSDGYTLPLPTPARPVLAAATKRRADAATPPPSASTSLDVDLALGRPKRRLAIAAAVGGLALVAGGAFFFGRGAPAPVATTAHEAPAPAAPRPPPAPAAAPPVPVAAPPAPTPAPEKRVVAEVPAPPPRAEAPAPSRHRSAPHHTPARPRAAAPAAPKRDGSANGAPVLD